MKTTRSILFAERQRSSTWFILVSAMMANFTDLFIYSAIVPVAPFALPTRANIAFEDVQYWISIMLAVFNVFSILASLPSGYISDKMGICRPMFIVGTILQFTGLILLIIGNHISLWIAGRALQGIACAIVLTTTLPLLLEAAPKEQSARYLGLFSMSASVALISGPLVGGIVYNRCGYYSVLAICLVLNFVDLVLRLSIIEKRPNDDKSKADLEEIDSERGTVDNHVHQSKEHGTRVQTIEVLDTDSDSVCKQSETTMISCLRNKSIVFDLVCSPRMLAALYGALLYTTTQTAFDATLSLFVEEKFGWNSIGGGLIFVPLLLSDFCGPLFGYFSDKIGARATCTFGFLFGVTPLVCLRFVERNSIEHKVLLCALLAMTGLAMAAVLPAVMSEIGTLIEEKSLARSGGTEDVGAVSRAYGLFNIAYSGGCLIGPLWGGFVKNSAGWDVLGWSSAIFWASGIVPVLIW